MSGVTVLRDRVFLVRRWTSRVEVYGVNTLKLQNTFTVERLHRPIYLTSCSVHGCLYIADLISPYEIHRVHIGTCDHLVQSQWSLENTKPEGISVTPKNATVLVACIDARELQEFTTDGRLIRTVRLPADMMNTSHAIQFCGNVYRLSRLVVGSVESRLHRRLQRRSQTVLRSAAEGDRWEYGLAGAFGSR